MTAAPALPAYSAFHRILHWLIAASVLTGIAMGLTMIRIGPGPLQNRLYETHWSLGTLTFVLMVLRLVSRMHWPTPPLPASVPGWQRLAAHVNHGLLYAALMVQPVLGYIGKATFGGVIPFFGLFNVPVVLPKNEQVARAVLNVHSALGIAILVLVVIHVAAALHHARQRDGVFSRMITG